MSEDDKPSRKTHILATATHEAGKINVGRLLRDGGLVCRVSDREASDYGRSWRVLRSARSGERRHDERFDDAVHRAAVRPAVVAHGRGRRRDDDELETGDDDHELAAKPPGVVRGPTSHR